MSATITEIAKIASVSIATVSRVLNNSNHPISESTRQRILKLAEELNYQPNLVARSLRLDSTKTIGIIVENMLSPFISTIITGIQETLKPAGYMSFILNTNENPEIEIESIKALNHRQIDGIVFVATWDRSPKMVEGLTGKPYVFVHRHFETYTDNSVLVDERWGAGLAVGHLARLGHQRIAFIAGPQDWDASIFRLQGYREALQANGLPFDPDLIVGGNWEIEGGIQAVEGLLRQNKLPSAIFAANDPLALGAIYALQDHCIRVPEDVAIIGYDDRDFASFVRPSITTVTLPCFEMGVAAADLILKMMKCEIKSSLPVEIRGRLIVRDSCGASLSAESGR
jgi:DNA-binding LacI/PurR family transcriptional regulator